MTIQATFIGTDSLGYKKGNTYDLILSNHSGVTIKRKDLTGVCVYTSLSSFLSNWDSIKHLK